MLLPTAMLDSIPAGAVARCSAVACGASARLCGSRRVRWCKSATGSSEGASAVDFTHQKSQEKAMKSHEKPLDFTSPRVVSSIWSLGQGHVVARSAEERLQHLPQKGRAMRPLRSSHEQGVDLQALLRTYRRRLEIKASSDLRGHGP